jgi:hypothetical protein
MGVGTGHVPELSPADLRNKVHGRKGHAPAPLTQLAKKQQEWVEREDVRSSTSTDAGQRR